MNPAVLMALFPDVVSVSNTASAIVTTDLTTYTHSSQALGEAIADRIIVVHISGFGGSVSRTISSVTIGGGSATEIITAIANGDGNDTVLSSLYSAKVPTGTTGDVVVVFSGAMDNCAIIVYRLANVSATISDTGSDITLTGNAVSDTLNIPAGGAAIAGVCFLGTAARTVSWTNITETSGTDGTIEGNTTRSGAHDTFTSTQTALTLTATASGTLNGNGGALVMASFGPA